MTLEEKLINAHHKLWLRFVAINDMAGLRDLYDCSTLTGKLFEKYYALEDKISFLKNKRNKKRKSK